MSMRGLGACALAFLIPLAAAGGQDGSAASLTAPQIVEKNAQARGGLEGWRKIDTMVWTGHIETGSPVAPMVPFVFELKRPNKTRFELREDQDKMVRVFDGAAGWKVSVRPSSERVRVPSCPPDALPWTRTSPAPTEAPFTTPPGRRMMSWLSRIWIDPGAGEMYSYPRACSVG